MPQVVRLTCMHRFEDGALWISFVFLGPTWVTGMSTHSHARRPLSPPPMHICSCRCGGPLGSSSACSEEPQFQGGPSHCRWTAWTSWLRIGPKVLKSERQMTAEYERHICFSNSEIRGWKFESCFSNSEIRGWKFESGEVCSQLFI